MLDKLWDDVVAGPTPERGLDKLRRIVNHSLTVKTDEDGAASSSSGKVYGVSMPASPGTPVTPKTPMSARKADNVWRSVFNPGSNLNTKGLGAALFDKPDSPNSPTVYDWLYSGETRSKHH